MGDEKNNSDLEVVKNTIIDINCDVKQIDKDIRRVASNKRKFDFYTFLGGLVNLCDVAKNAKNIIKPNLEYAVKFTPELLKKMKEHDVQFLNDNITGEILPVLYDYTEKGFGGQVRLELKGNITNQDFANFSNSLTNLLEQKKFDALVEQIQQIHSTVKRIERGQDNDRFALVISGREKLLHALSIENDDELKKSLIIQAISTLCDGRKKVELSLIDKLNDITIVPNNDFKRIIKCLKPGYYNTQTDRYENIQEYFEYYCMSIEPLAYAYTCLNQPQMVEKVLKDCQNVFNHPKLSYLASVESLLNKFEYGESYFSETWYSNPKKHEKKLLESYQDFDVESDMYIRFNGQDLLEVLSDEETE